MGNGTRTIRWCVAETTFGAVLVAATEQGICRLAFGEDEMALARHHPLATLVHDPDTLLIQAALLAIASPERAHDLPIDAKGSVFQQRVWAELRRIPPGQTRSYAEIAAAVGQPGAVRAVGTANGSNPIAILVPCHRVVRSDGSLGGYAGGLETKRLLLRAEGVSLAQLTLL